ncbi:hypothetical protein HDE_12959 [Halotydeus destructor]|nr:hypothetical protein HDE_12959 [Halotydeus destructor]
MMNRLSSSSMSCESVTPPVGAPSILDMRRPCPADAAQFQLFIEEYFDGHFPSVSSIILPKWFPGIFSDDSEFLGEVLLLAYPSLDKIPDTLSYPRILLEQYTTSPLCRIKQLPTPDIFDVFFDQYEANECPYAGTFEDMYSNLAESLHVVDLTRGELIPLRLTEALVEDLLAGKFPELKTLKITISKIFEKELLEKIAAHTPTALRITACVDGDDDCIDELDYFAAWKALRSSCATLEVKSSLPLIGQIKSLACEATTLVLKGVFLEKRVPEHMELKPLKTLGIEYLSADSLDSFLSHMVMMRFPGLEILKIRCFRTLAHLPLILMKTEIFTLNCFKAETHHCRMTQRAPRLDEEFMAGFREKAIKRRNEITLGEGQDLVGPYDEPLDLCLNSDCEMSEDEDDNPLDDHVEFPAEDQPFTRAKLRGWYRREKKNLLHQVLSTLTWLSSEHLQTVEISIDTIGGFTCAFLKFLLATKNQTHKKLRLSPAALQGGMAINLIPVVFGLSRNWADLELAFWCLPEELEKAKSSVRQILEAESKHHNTIELVVKSEKHFVHGEFVNGIIAVRTIPVPTSHHFCLVDLCIDQPSTAKVLGAEFKSARDELMVISNHARRAVLANVPEAKMYDLESVLDACNRLCRSEKETNEALKKIELLSIEELKTSDILYNTMDD